MELPFKGNKIHLGEGRNWVILAVSLLLAFFMWSVMKLSRNYSSYIRYHVEVTSSIPGRTNSAISVDELVIGAKSKGFDILQNSRNSGNNLLHLASVDPRHFHKSPKGKMSSIFFPTISASQFRMRLARTSQWSHLQPIPFISTSRYSPTGKFRCRYTVQ